VPLSTQEYKWVPAICWGNLTNCGEVTCDGLASRPGGVEILLAASYYGNRDKLRQYEPVWLIRLHSLTSPTIVSAHTFCASRKTWFKRALGLTLTRSTTLQIKAKFSYCDQIKFNEPILEPGTPK